MMKIKRKLLHCWFVVPVMALFLFVSVQTSAHQTRFEATTKVKGGLYLVGMGPGDPDLATVRALRIVEEADLILCCNGLTKKFHSFLNGKEVIVLSMGVGRWHGYGKNASDFQGEERKRVEASQKARSQIITKVRKAIKEGKSVAVLCHGDPLTYGAWVWCLEEFEDLNPVVVPGVSCFNAANAALKKDVTWSRKIKSTILTAYDWPGYRDTIEKLANNQVTMVIFTMGLDLKDIIARLSTHYPRETPVAIVCHAGYKAKERVIKATLETVLDKTRNKKLPYEHLVYVGENLSLKWKNE